MVRIDEAHEAGLLTERNVLRVESTECQIACDLVSRKALQASEHRVRTHHSEQSLWPQITIAALELALLVQAPDRLDTARKLFTADAADGVADGANATQDAASVERHCGMKSTRTQWQR